MATILFVLLAEVLIFAPSVGRFRANYLEGLISDAHLATLVLSVTDEYMVTDMLRKRLLETAGAHGIAISGPGFRGLVLASDMPPAADTIVDLAETGLVTHIVDSFHLLLRGGSRFIRVSGPAPDGSGLVMEVVIDEHPMRVAMLGFAERIAGLSILISLFTAGLVFVALQWFFVRPLRRTTESMVAFRADPEDRRAIIVPSDRGDEIGIAQRELAEMQREISAALNQKTRLAALGTAVTKINHDLRNILSTAGLVSEGLASSEHPEVRRSASKLVAAIDRAAILCSQTLDYARSGTVIIAPARFKLAGLVNEVGQEFKSVAAGNAVWRNEVRNDLEVDADRDQIFRVLVNLGRNALEAGAKSVVITARPGEKGHEIDIADDGPGLPDAVRDRLFEPFAGGGRTGGTGLGLAIAREIVQSHRGELSLVSSSETGTIFRLALPAAKRRSRRSRSMANG